MTVVDTSVWVTFFRGRMPPLISEMARLRDRDEVVLVAPVRVELISGAGKRDAALLAAIFDRLPTVFPTESTWQTAAAWALEASTSGDHFGVADLLIAALSTERRAVLWSLDGEFVRMSKRRWVTLHTPPLA